MPRSSFRPLRDERGIALAVAVFALVIIGALVAGTFFAGRLEQKGGAGAMQSTQAFEAAEAGMSDAVANWNRDANGLAVGDVMSLADQSLPGVPSVHYTTSATRLTPSVFLIRSEGQQLDAANRPLARRVLATLVKLTPPDMDIQSALTLRGHLTLGGSAEVHGEDDVPSNWPTSGASPLCPPPGAAMPGIRGSDLDITTNGSNCSGLGCVTGSPRLLEDSSVTASTFTQFGDLNFDQLAAAANWVVSGTMNGMQPSIWPVPAGSPAGTYGACKTSDPKNWGEPTAGTQYRKCLNYFPILYAPGNLRLTGGTGQGILLVRGDLDLSGGVEFYGPVVVLGNVTSTGQGGHIYGGLMASNADLDNTTITGNSVVSYSSCAVSRALLGAAFVRPMQERGWAQVY